jgi:hypothetical protein
MLPFSTPWRVDARGDFGTIDFGAASSAATFPTGGGRIHRRQIVRKSKWKWRKCAEKIPLPRASVRA